MNRLLQAAGAALVGLSLLGAGPAPRPPVGAGRFYPADPKELGALADGLLARAPAPRLAGPVVAVLVPHAGLAYSGAVAAAAFRAADGQSYDDVIVIGTGHYKPLEGAAIYPGAYADTEGAFPYDEALARDIAKGSRLVVFDASAHAKEHSIEVELPFLRRVAGKAKLVALVMNTQDLEAARAVGAALARAAKGRRVLLVASSDQAHFPPRAVAASVDATTLAALERLSPSLFWFTNRLLLNRGLPNLAVTYCGEGPVTATLVAAQALGADRFQTLARSDSSASLPESDKSRVVGYAAGVFVRAPSAQAPAPLSAAERAELVADARRALRAQLTRGKAPMPGLSARPALNLPAAASVTLRRKSDGAARGRGGSQKAEAPLNWAVAKAAAEAGVADPSVTPLSRAELDSVRVEVTVGAETFSE